MLIENLKSTLSQHKAEDIAIYYDIHHAGEVYIVASCTSNRHSKALAQYIIQDLKNSDTQYDIEGLSEGNWILIGIGDVFLHLFVDSARIYYDVDKLWKHS